METCPAHSATLQRLDDLQKWSDARDVEQETAITGVSRRMDELHDDVQALKSDVRELGEDVKTIRETMPDTITRNITAYIESLIVRTVKTFFKWFFRVLLGGTVVMLVGMFLQGLFNG